MLSFCFGFANCFHNFSKLKDDNIKIIYSSFLDLKEWNPYSLHFGLTRMIFLLTAFYILIKTYLGFLCTCQLKMSDSFNLGMNKYNNAFLIFVEMNLAHVENIRRHKYTISKKKEINWAAKWDITLRQDFFCKINDNSVSIHCLYATVQVACNSYA